MSASNASSHSCSDDGTGDRVYKRKLPNVPDPMTRWGDEPLSSSEAPVKICPKFGDKCKFGNECQHRQHVIFPEHDINNVPEEYREFAEENEMIFKCRSIKNGLCPHPKVERVTMEIRYENETKMTFRLTPEEIHRVRSIVNDAIIEEHKARFSELYKVGGNQWIDGLVPSSGDAPTDDHFLVIVTNMKGVKTNEFITWQGTRYYYNAYWTDRWPTVTEVISMIQESPGFVFGIPNNP